RDPPTREPPATPRPAHGSQAPPARGAAAVTPRGAEAPGAPGRSPRAEYAGRLEARRATLERRTRLERRTAAGGPAGVPLGLGLVLLALALWVDWIAWFWALGPVAAYVVLVVVHDRLRRTSGRVARAVAYYENGLRRLDGTWAGTGVSGLAFLDPEHPYAAD